MNVPISSYWSKITLFIYSFFFDNFSLKLLSFIIALSIWFLAPLNKQENNTKLQLFIPIFYTNQPANLTMTSKPPHSLTIQLLAQQQVVDSLTSGKLSANIDLSDATIGTYTVNLTSKNINLPRDARLLQMTPQTIHFVFAKTAVKTVPIYPVFSGKPADGYSLRKSTLSIKEIAISGTEKELKKIKHIETQAIPLDNLMQNTQLPVSLSLPNTISLASNDHYVTIYVTITSRLVSQRIMDVPVGIEHQKYVTKLNPWHINLLVRAPLAKLKTLNKNQIQAFIDLSRFKPGKYKIKKPKIVLDPQIQVQKVWPPLDVWILKQKLE